MSGERRAKRTGIAPPRSLHLDHLTDEDEGPAGGWVEASGGDGGALDLVLPRHLWAGAGITAEMVGIAPPGTVDEPKDEWTMPECGDGSIVVLAHPSTGRVARGPQRCKSMACAECVLWHWKRQTKAIVKAAKKQGRVLYFERFETMRRWERARDERRPALERRLGRQVERLVVVHTSGLVSVLADVDLTGRMSTVGALAWAEHAYLADDVKPRRGRNPSGGWRVKSRYKQLAKDDPAIVEEALRRLGIVGTADVSHGIGPLARALEAEIVKVRKERRKGGWV